MDLYRLLGIEHDGRESASARVVSREPNKWGVFPLHTFNSGDEVVLAADALATIAALHAEVKGYQTKTYCAFCGQTYDIDTGAELIARHIKECPKHPMRDVESQLTQRTAELEAVRVDNRTYINERHENMKQIESLQAELERVRGKMSRPFDGYGNYVRLTRKEIEAMSWAGAEGAGNWRDGAVSYTHHEPCAPMFKGSIVKDVWVRVSERSRTYHFANNVTTSVDQPWWLWVSSSGTHYIKDSCGKIHIINKAWVRITITE